MNKKALDKEKLQTLQKILDISPSLTRLRLDQNPGCFRVPQRRLSIYKPNEVKKLKIKQENKDAVIEIINY